MDPCGRVPPGRGTLWQHAVTNCLPIAVQSRQRIFEQRH